MWKKLTENPEITIFPQILLPLIVILYFKLSILLINFAIKIVEFFKKFNHYNWYYQWFPN